MTPSEISINLLSDDFEREETLIAVLDFKPDPSQLEEQERESDRELAEQLGISLEDAEFIQQYRSEFEHLREGLLARAANQDAVERASTSNRERRRKKLKERKQDAPTKESELKVRSVATSPKGVVDRQQLFGFYLDEEAELFCQMCLDSMPFIRKAGDDSAEVIALFTKAVG